MRLVFLGDSLTWGGYGGNFVDEVARLMPEHEIINEGSGGDTAVNLLRRLDNALAHEPDGVFVMVGGNDAISYSQPGTRGYYRWHNAAPPDGRMTLDLFTRSYRDLLTRLHLAHVLAWAALEPCEYNPATVAAQKLFNDHIRELAGSLSVPVLDLFSILTPEHVAARPPLDQTYINLIGRREQEGWSAYEAERRKGGFSYSFDGIHFTPETAKRVARIIAEFLRAQLANE